MIVDASRSQEIISYVFIDSNPEEKVLGLFMIIKIGFIILTTFFVD